MRYSVDLDGGDGAAFQARQENPPKRISDRVPVPFFKRLGIKPAEGIGQCVLVCL